jgi:hypothetical protein
VDGQLKLQVELYGLPSYRAIDKVCLTQLDRNRCQDFFGVQEKGGRAALIMVSSYFFSLNTCNNRSERA